MDTTTAVPVRAGSVDAARAVRAARFVSMVLVVVMVTAAAIGLAARGVYRDPEEVVALFRGYDVVALVLAAPLLVVVPLRRTPRGLLVWGGLLAYAAYNYAYYLFGAELGVLFGLYVAAVVLSVVGLVLLLAAVDMWMIAEAYRVRTPVRSVAGVLLLLGISLAALWAFTVVQVLATGSVLDEPSQLVVPASFTQLGAALDLTLLVPGYVVAGVLLWRRAASGYVAVPVLLVAGVLHQIAYMTALVFQAVEDIPGATVFDAAEPFITAAYVVAAAVMLWSCGGWPSRGAAR